MLAENSDKDIQKIIPTDFVVDMPKQLAESLNLLGQALSCWDGKDLENISKSSKLVMTSCVELFKTTGNKEFLFCHLIVQYSMSMLFSRTFFAGSLRLHSAISDQTYTGFGAEFMEASKKVGTKDFQSSLLNVLTYAYINQLVPVI